MSKNCIIYLGGSITQSTNFEYLKNKNLKIILIDQNPNCYCKKFCDIFLNLSQTNLRAIIKNLRKIIKKENYKVLDCFGLAHYSYPAVNLIKSKFIKDFKKDKFLMNKDYQKKVFIKENLTSKYFCLPGKKTFKIRRKFYMRKIFNFLKKNKYNIFLKTNGTHQGIGIIHIKTKYTEDNFNKIFFKKILKNFENSNKLYLEAKANGRLINIDFIKVRNEVIFLPLIYRDKVILKGKKKYLSVFQYLNNQNIINDKLVSKLKKIIKDQFKKTRAFGTIDALVDNDDFNVLEVSPHFHNVKIHEFLNNKKILDIYFDDKKRVKKFNTNLGGYIFLHQENIHTKNLFNFVKKNSSKIMIDYIDIKTREIFLKRHAFIKEKFHLVYFMSNKIKDIELISNYIIKNKKNLYN